MKSAGLAIIVESMNGLSQTHIKLFFLLNQKNFLMRAFRKAAAAFLPHNVLMKFRGKYARHGRGLNPEYPWPSFVNALPFGQKHKHP
jgi:hypothetical protein